MAERKEEPFLDWYGNPLRSRTAGLPRPVQGVTFQGETDPDGKRYIRAYSAGGVPGDRLPLDHLHHLAYDSNDRVVYDSRRPPPPDANLLPRYIGYERERILKRYFPE